jgi:hypothetical protein
MASPRFFAAKGRIGGAIIQVRTYCADPAAKQASVVGRRRMLPIRSIAAKKNGARFFAGAGVPAAVARRWVGPPS